MVTFPNCKINLGLYITGKRGDGFHNLETLFYPINLTDVLEIIAANEPAANDIRFSSSGINVTADPNDNICVKAYRLIRQKYPYIPPVQMHLHKAIPSGAGLGGGSADGAFTLQLLNQKFNIGLSAAELIDYALQLGSDCPFFIINKPVIATGRGEIMQEVSLDLSSYKLVLVNPGVHVNTGWAFARLGSYSPAGSIGQITEMPVSQWRDALRNDFEAPLTQQYPAFTEIKDQLYGAGAVYAAMSGSGSTFYGIFEKTAEPDLSQFPAHYFVKVVDFL